MRADRRLGRVLRHRIAARLVLGTSLLVTALAWFVSQRSIAQRRDEQFAHRTDSLVEAIRRRMFEQVQVLRAAAGLFEASAEVTRAGWRDYVESLGIAAAYPGLQGIGFCPRVAAADRGGHEAAVRAEGLAGYAVHPLGAGPEAFPVAYLEPATGRNLRAFGFDIGSEAVRRAALERARDTGEPTLSGRLILVQETDHDVQPGFLLLAPIYRHGLPIATPAERRVALRGFVYSPFRSDDLLTGILGPGLVDVRLAIHDGEPSPSNLLYDSAAAADGVASLRRTVELEVAGRAWNLAFEAAPSFGGLLDTHQPLLVACGGLLIDLLLFLIFSSLATVEARATRQAAAMTDELRAAAAALRRSLAEKEILLMEVHHRVKNNLQVISSLLWMQEQGLADPASRAALRDSQARIQAMAAVHVQLYGATDLASIDMGPYLEDLGARLRRSHGRSAEAIALITGGGGICLGVDRAVPCGLIANELLSNSFKHGFPGGRTGRIEVALERTADGRLRLTIGDDGVGIGDHRTPDPSGGLGLQIVAGLVEQLRGTLEVRSTSGHRVTVVFDADAGPAA